MACQEQYFDQGNRLTQDSCAIVARDLENQSVFDYLTFNPKTLPCEGEIKRISDFQSCYPNLRFKSGYGQVPSCRIDGDSAMRYNPETLRHPERKPLYTRVFTAAPNLGKGTCVPNTESYLKTGAWDTTLNKDCSSLAETNFDRYTPFLSCVQNYIDSYAESVGSVNVIGTSSRDEMRHEDAQRQCNIGRS
jgi:hypothetical protein